MAALEREKEREERRRIELEEMRIQEEQAAEDRRKAEEEARMKAEGLYTQETIMHTKRIKVDILISKPGDANIIPYVVISYSVILQLSNRRQEYACHRHSCGLITVLL